MLFRFKGSLTTIITNMLYTHANNKKQNVFLIIHLNLARDLTGQSDDLDENKKVSEQISCPKDTTHYLLIVDLKK